MVSSHSVTACTLTKIIFRAIFEAEKSKGTVRRKSQREELNYVYIGDGHGRGQFHHFILVLVDGGFLITLSYSPFQDHYPSTNNLKLGLWPLFLLLKGKLPQRGRYSSCTENPFQVPQPPKHSVSRISNTFPQRSKTLRLLFGLRYWSCNQMINRGIIEPLAIL